MHTAVNINFEARKMSFIERLSFAQMYKKGAQESILGFIRFHCSPSSHSLKPPPPTPSTYHLEHLGTVHQWVTEILPYDHRHVKVTLLVPEAVVL